MALRLLEEPKLRLLGDEKPAKSSFDFPDIAKKAIRTAVPFIGTALFPTPQEKITQEFIFKGLNVPQQSLFSFAESPEKGVGSAIQHATKVLMGEEEPIRGRDLLKTRGWDLDKNPSLAGEFVGASLDVLADPIYLIPSVARGAKQLSPAYVRSSALTSISEKLLKNPKYTTILEREAVKQGISAEAVHNAILRKGQEGLAKTPYWRNLNLALGQTGTGRIGKVNAIAKQFNLKPAQIENLKKGITTDLPAGAVKAYQAIPQAPKTPPAEGVKPPVVEGIPKELQPLADEARKYKNVEEFMGELNRLNKQFKKSVEYRPVRSTVAKKKISDEGAFEKLKSLGFSLESTIQPQAGFNLSAEKFAFKKMGVDTLFDFYNQVKAPQDLLEEAKTIHKIVIEKKQPILDKIMADTVDELGLEKYKSEPKTPESLIEKVSRKPKGYAIYSAKDHARGSIFIKDFSQIPDIILSLSKKLQFRGESSIDVPLNRFGYRGIMLTTSLGDNINGEIQLHTKKSWDVKKISDNIYRKWRPYEKNGELDIPPDKQADYLKDMQKSWQMWENFWNKIPQATKVAASSSVKGLESVISPKIPSKVVQVLPRSAETRAHLPLDIGETSKTLPSGNHEYGIKDIAQSPSNSNIPQKVKNVKDRTFKPKVPRYKTIAGKIKSEYKGGIDPRIVRRRYPDLLKKHPFIFKKGGIPIDTVATEILGNTSIPEIYPTPEDYLMDLLYTNEPLSTIVDEPGVTTGEEFLKEFDPLATKREKIIAQEAKNYEPKVKEIESVLPKTKVKPTVRLSTGQYERAEPTITEPQALKRIMKREEQVARQAGRLTKAETKEALKLTQKIKKLPIQGMAFEERTQLESLKSTLRKTRTLAGLRELSVRMNIIKERGKQRFIQTKQARDTAFALDKEILLKTMRIAPPPKTPKGVRSLEPSRAGEAPKITRAVTLRPPRVFDALDGGQNFEGSHSKYFYQRANQAEDIKLRGIGTRTDSMIQEMKRIGISEQDLMKTRVVDGITFTADEMISLYTGAKNIEKTLALVYGNKIPFATMRNVIAQMTPQEKALGEAIIKDYETNYPRLRKSFIEYTDGKTDLGKVRGGYTPIRRTMNGYIPTENELANELLERANLRKAYANRGFTKERIKIPKEYQQPIRLGELGIWNEQMAKQEHFISYGNLVKDFQRMVNNPAFSERVRDKLGQPYLEVTRNWVNRVANPNIYKAYSQQDKVVSTLRQNAAIAYLGVNLVTMLKQAPSLALFLEDVSAPELLGGIYDLTTDHKNNMKMIHELSPQMKNRSIERELEELKNTDPNKYRALIKKYGNKAMFGIYEIDKLVTHSGWLAVYNKNTALGLSELEAADKATRTVLRTQPAAHAKDLPDLYATNELWNTLLQFTNQLNQIYNILTYDIPTAARTGRYRDAMRAAFGVALSAYLIASIQKGKFIANSVELVKEGVNQLLAYIPLVGRGYQAMEKGFDFISIPALAGLKSAGETVRYTVKGKFAKALGKGIETGAVLLGIPYAQPKRLISGAKDLTTGRSRDLRRLVYSKYNLQGKKRRSGKKLRLLN